jgi:hypothetical protein
LYSACSTNRVALKNATEHGSYSWPSYQHIFTAISHGQVRALWQNIGIEPLDPCPTDQSHDHRIVNLVSFQTIEMYLGQGLGVHELLVKPNAIRAAKKSPALGDIGNIANQHFSALRQQFQRPIQEIPNVSFHEDGMEQAVHKDHINFR